MAQEVVMKINKKETVTEKPPRHEAKNTFDSNEDGKKAVKRKTGHHVTVLTNKLHGSDPYCHVK
jgi:hypothetical protein